MATTVATQDSPNKLSIRERSEIEERIHVLGTGSIGKFVAHAIQKHTSPPPITLLFHKPSYLNQFNNEENNSRLSVTSYGTPTTAGPLDSELVLPARKRNWRGSKGQAELLDREDTERRFGNRPSDTPIKHLIVTVKAHQTVKSLLPLKSRLTKDSSILFLQNGCGIVEEVNEQVFPDPAERPAYLLGINSHGVHATGTSTVVHAGHGVIYLGILPREGDQTLDPASSQNDGMSEKYNNRQFSETSRHLLRSLTRLPVLAALPVPPSSLTLYQLDKLAVNCVINPLTVLLDAPNGSLLHNHNLSRTMRLLLFEISAIFRRLPEVQGIPNIDLRFSPDRLEDLCLGTARKTGDNISSMLQDVRRGAETEIDYLNGWVVRRGESLGVKAVVNYSMVSLVRGKQAMVSREVEGYVPHEGRSRSGRL